MNTEKVREEFEAWFEGETASIEKGMPEYCISAMRFNKEVLWHGWQASRAAIEIELPQPVSIFSGGQEQEGAEIYYYYASEKIKSYGLKVNP